MSARLLALALGPAAGVVALDNGVGRTPPMGFNSYMSPSSLHNEKGLTTVGDFFVSSGLHAKGFEYVNTDEGWELPIRDANGDLAWDPLLYPSGLPKFIDSLHEKGLKFGIYGAASGVTCGKMPGNLYHEIEDAATYAKWGVDYVKSDNCATYALDPSVRFAALRDALNATDRQMLLSIEPFSINPDPALSREVSNIWRIGCDISGDYATVLDRADLSDKWAPLAGPGGFNDPDMINLQNPPSSEDGSGFTLAENRMYFGLWAIMKAPLLLSADLPNLDSAIIDDIVGNEEVIAINQDPLGIQARKIQIYDGAPLPWLVGLEDCSISAGTTGEFYSRRWDTSTPAGQAGNDTRVWKAVLLPPPHSANSGVAGKYQLVNSATGRCLTIDPETGSRVVLLPCFTSSGPNAYGIWEFNKGISTVTSISSALTGQALAVSNTTLFATSHGTDDVQVSDAAYGQGGITLLDRPYIQANCSSRSCENYDPSQMWFYDSKRGLVRHSQYSASINHMPAGQGSGYTLSPKVPTSRRNCLAHVLSTANLGTQASNASEVWAGPLEGGDYVLALVNRGDSNSTVMADFSLMVESGVGDIEATSYKVRDLWAKQDVGNFALNFSATVGAHDVQLYRLTPS